MKVFTSKSQKIGQTGENIACKYLQSKGFLIIERNFTLRCGEIDIIASREGIIHFVEVKTVLYREKGYFIRPEDNMHRVKLRKFIRSCLVYVDMRHIADTTDWQVDVLAIEYDARAEKAYIRHIESVH